MSKPDSLADGEALRLSELIAPAPSGIASRVLANATGGSVSLFAFDEGKVSASTRRRSMRCCWRSMEFSVTIGENKVNAEPGTIIRLPANIRHPPRPGERRRDLDRLGV